MSQRRLAPKTRIQRHGNGHSYYQDGEKVPGVTTIMGNGIPKNGLIGWAANSVADVVVNGLALVDGHIIADELVREMLEWNATRGQHAVKTGNEKLPRLALAKILASVRYRDVDEAANRGTEVHSLAAQLAHGKEIDVPDVLDGHVRSYLKFLEEWDPTEALIERVVVNRRWRYMGKLDLIARFDGVWPAGTPWAGQPIGRGLVDLKTSRSGIFSETGLQLAGYRYAESMLDGVDGAGQAIEIRMPQVDWCGAVWIRADGYDVYRLDVTEKTFRVFLYAKHVGEWLDFKEGPAGTIKSDAIAPPTKGILNVTASSAQTLRESPISSRTSGRRDRCRRRSDDALD